MIDLLMGLQKEIDASALKKQLCPGAGAFVALVGSESMEVFSLGSGIDASTPVEIGSLTKVFTALLVAEAVRRSELELNTRLDETLFGERWKEPAITAEHLATHTSGLPRISMAASEILLHASDPYRTYDRVHLIKWLRSHKPYLSEAFDVSYSNFGYAVLGLILEKATSESYENLLQERLLDPLGMRDTSLHLTGKADRAANGYSPRSTRTSVWHQDAYAPCGAMVSTVNDLAKAIRSFLGPSSVVAEALAITLQPRRSMPGGNIGLAWILPAGGNSFWHNGATGGYSSYLGICKRGMYKLGGTGIVVVANQSLGKQVTELGHRLLQIIAQPAHTS